MIDEIIEVAIKDIQIGQRFRKDFGDLDGFARQIEEVGLLQPIGLTEDLELVFGERRLRAYRDVLKRDTIPARIIDVRSVLIGQTVENSMRADLTVSEKVAVADHLRGYGHGGDRKSDRVRNSALERLTVDGAAKLAGLRNRDAYDRARAVVRNGVPALVEAMDRGEIALSAAAEMASLAPEVQNSLLSQRADWTASEIFRLRRELTPGVVPEAAESVERNGEEAVPSRPFSTLPLPLPGRVVADAPPTEGDGPTAEDDDRDGPVEECDGYNFYPTHRFVTEALLDVEGFGSSVWEPACGDGAISEVLIAEGYEVYSSDIVDRGYGAVEDFLVSDRTVESIVTNPDFDYAKEFVSAALDRTTSKVAMLLPLTFLASKGRYDLLRNSPLKCVHVFTGRVSLRSASERTSKGNGRESYAWFVWDHSYEGDPTIHFFPPDLGEAERLDGRERPKPKHAARSCG